MKYDQYLRTVHFNKIRNKTMAYFGGQCWKCGRMENLNIHHIRYNLWSETPGVDTVVLCKYCHSEHHSRKKRLERYYNKTV